MDNKIRKIILKEFREEMGYENEEPVRVLDKILTRMVQDARKMNRTISEMRDEIDQEFGDVLTVEGITGTSTERSILKKPVLTGPEVTED